MTLTQMERKTFDGGDVFVTFLTGSTGRCVISGKSQTDEEIDTPQRVIDIVTEQAPRAATIMEPYVTQFETLEDGTVQALYEIPISALRIVKQDLTTWEPNSVDVTVVDLPDLPEEEEVVVEELGTHGFDVESDQQNEERE